jgi:hypothetical protein
MHRLFTLVAALALLIVAGCSDSTTNNPPGSTGIYTISGKLKFDSSLQIPANAQAMVVWSVSSGSPDYTYVFGHGAINMTDSTFKVVFDSAPPAAALNSYGLGVGLVVVSSIPFPDGKLTDQQFDTLQTHLSGGSEDYAVIYLGKSPDSVALGRGWAKNFNSGFNVGRGIRKQGQFDEFEPAAATAIQLVIDIWSRLDWVNWT